MGFSISTTAVLLHSEICMLNVCRCKAGKCIYLNLVDFWEPRIVCQ